MNRTLEPGRAWLGLLRPLIQRDLRRNCRLRDPRRAEVNLLREDVLPHVERSFERSFAPLRLEKLAKQGEGRRSPGPALRERAHRRPPPRADRGSQRRIKLQVQALEDDLDAEAVAARIAELRDDIVAAERPGPGRCAPAAARVRALRAPTSLTAPRSPTVSSGSPETTSSRGAAATTRSPAAMATTRSRATAKATCSAAGPKTTR